MVSETYCVLPWQSLSIDNQGRSRICCNNDAHYRGPFRELVNHMASATEAMHTPYHHAVRQAQLQAQRHPSCKKCWDIEDSGGRSFRQIWNDILQSDAQTMHTEVRYLDITLGNKCNLTCRMCNEWNSHLWQIDNQRLGRPSDPTLTNTDWFQDAAARKIISENLHTVTHINFLGGEPLIVREQLDILRRCVELGRAAEINLSYNTNMTTLLAGQLELWREFKQVDLGMSLEGTGTVNDYIRQNSSWTDILFNIDSVHTQCPGVRMTVHSTFGIMNCLTLGSMTQALMDFPALLGRLPWLNIITYPANQDTRHLPIGAKHMVRAAMISIMQDHEHDSNLSSWTAALNHLDQPGDTEQWASFWQEVDQLDAYKHTSITHSLPELASYRP